MKNLRQPWVYKAARWVGVLLPKFEPESQGKIFADRFLIKGTCFWIKDPPILVTCSHVVESMAYVPTEFARLLVIGNNGNYIRASIGLLDFMHDLAFLIPQDVTADVLDRESQSGLEVADGYPKVGEEVEYAGFPLGFQLLDSHQAPSYAKGVISAQVRDEGMRKVIQVTGSIASGYSGSPIVTPKNPRKVIGMISNSPSKEAGDAQIFMAVSWEHLKVVSRMITS